MSSFDDIGVAMIPSGYKEDKLYSVLPNSGDGDFDFSRSSSATRVNSEGLIETVRILISEEEVTNGNFDTNSDWSLRFAVIEDGVVKLQENSSTYSRVRQDTGFIGQAKVTYTISFNNTSITTIQLRSHSGSNFGNVPATVGTHTVYNNFTDTAVSFQSGILAVGEEIHLDNVSVKEVIENDVPRLDYSGGVSCPVLLLEPQSTNKVTQSETFSSWSRIFSILTSTNISAPDGSNSVIKMSSSDLAVREHKVIIHTNQTSATDSIFAKMGEVRYIMNRRNSSNVSWQSVVFDLQEGVVAANNYSSEAYPKITHYGNGWYRCEVYYADVSNNETGWGLSDGINQNYSATNTTDGLYIWGAQQEDLSYATSYIPTEGSTVTRNADAANNSGNADLINSTEGVLYAEILKKQDNNDNFILISLNNDASNTDHNSVTLGFDAHIDFYFRVKSNNTVVLLSDTITANKNQFYKVALKYKSGDCAVWIDGVKQATSTTAFTFAQTLDNLSFDYKGNGQLPFYGNVKSVAVFKEALTDEELAKITSATQQEVFYEMRDRMNIKNYDYYEFGDYTTRLKKLF